MAFLFSLKKVLSLEINNFHNNKKRVQTPMLPSAIFGRLRGRTHRQKYQAEDRLLPGRQASLKFGGQPGFWEGDLHTRASTEDPDPGPQDVSQQQKNRPVSLCV